jgi:polyribonucleotide nucleotidyltransferase
MVFSNSLEISTANPIFSVQNSLYRGSFIKRDSRPKEHEVLVSRLVDRPLRPMVANGWPHSTQILQWVMSYDFEHAPEPLAITAAGAAMALSGMDWLFRFSATTPNYTAFSSLFLTLY